MDQKCMLSLISRLQRNIWGPVDGIGVLEETKESISANGVCHHVNIYSTETQNPLLPSTNTNESFLEM